MRHRNLSREEAIEEYLVYRKRVRELLDMARIATDIKEHKYEPRDLLGRGPDRFADAVGSTIVGLFASLLDPQKHALNAFDVWLVLFPKKKDKINETWDNVKAHVQLIRDYRNDIACHAQKGLRRYVDTVVKFQEARSEIALAMQAVSGLAAELLRDEATVLPSLRAEVDPILRKSFANLTSQQIEELKDYFLQKEQSA